MAAPRPETASPPAPLRLARAAEAFRLPDGLELRAGPAVMRVTAVADGILRVRAAPDGVFPPDESWAVLPRASRPPVQSHAPAGDGPAIRFATAELEVTATLDPLRVTICDRAGTVLLDDAPGRPTVFEGASFRAWKASPPDERYYGLGDKPGRLDRRGRAFQLWNTDDPTWQESTDPLYKAIPFLIGLRGGRAWGLLLDSTWRSSFDFGVSVPDAFSFGAEGGLLDYYVLAGPAPKAVLGRYAELTGAMPLPPLWALGFQQSRNSYAPEARVLEVAALHRGKRIPLDAIYLDIGFQDRNRPFTTDPHGFADFGGTVRTLGEAGIRTVAITDLHVAHQPGAGYKPFDTGAAGGHFVRNADGSLFVGESWPGACVFPEFARADTRAWWGGLYRDFYLRGGVAGFWNDMNEPSVRNGPGKTMPLDTQHQVEGPGHPARTATHAEMHNAYGLQNTQATHEGLLALDPDRRPFVLTRASYAGGHRFAATWTGDNASTWQHLRLCVPQLLSLGLGGFALAGSDVGGFQGSPSPELLTRWFQLGAWTPLFRDHAEKGTADQEAWVHGPEHEAIRRRAIEARYRLLPYLYAAVEEASRTGVPVMRPMFLEFPASGLDAEDHQFMVGSALLVAPPPDETLDAYPLKLPAGTEWYDYWTGRRLDASREVRLEKRLDRLPVFVRAGAIIPHQPLVQSTAETPDGPLRLHVYPGPDCAGCMYGDDGVSLAYQRGGFLRQRFACTVAAGGTRLRLMPHEGGWQPWWREIEVWLHGASRLPRRVEMDGHALDGVSFDESRGAVCFRVAATAAGGEVSITA